MVQGPRVRRPRFRRPRRQSLDRAANSHQRETRQSLWPVHQPARGTSNPAPLQGVDRSTGDVRLDSLMQVRLTSSEAGCTESSDHERVGPAAGRRILRKVALTTAAVALLLGLVGVVSIAPRPTSAKVVGRAKGHVSTDSATAATPALGRRSSAIQVDRPSSGRGLSGTM
jgi:hypothetical protein